MRIGVLTGGGDCPGLNAVIRAVVLTAAGRYGDDVVGFRDGWRGALEGDVVELQPEGCRDILPLGGTILGTSRTNPFASERGPISLMEVLSHHRVEAIVAIGGEDTLGVANRLGPLGVAVVGVPKTIDNDLSGTEVTFGFDTAVETATEAIDRLRTTAESHHRVIVCEVMGRNAGWIAAHAGIAGGAAEILVPEVRFDVATVCRRVAQRHQRGLYSSIVVISEGAEAVAGDGQDERGHRGHGGHGSHGGRPGDDGSAQPPSSGEVDQFGHPRLGGIGAWLAEEIERRTGYETRVTTLGHIQRGGTPSARDRVLATRFGVAAVHAVHEGDFGKMVALRDGEVIRIPIAEAVGQSKLLNLSLLEDVAEPFLG